MVKRKTFVLTQSKKICKALDCSINDLFDTDDPQVKRLLTYAYNVSKGDTTQ